MDYVDAPYMTQKARSQKPKNTFQFELDQKMRERRAKGLTADITSEESEGIVDDDGDSEEEAIIANYRSRQRKDRPTSAKRRSQEPALGETLRASDANKWLKSNKTKTQQENIPPVRGASPYESPRFSTQRDLDGMFGKQQQHRASPKEENIFSKSKTSPVEDPYGKKRSSPVQSSSTLPKSISGDRKSPKLSKEPSKEDLIFGKKTPTKEQMKESKEKKEWQAPSFRRSSPVMDQDRASSPSAAGSKGRRTPQDQSLMPISEGPRPAPRQRGPGSPTDPRQKQTEASPRSRFSKESSRLNTRSSPKDARSSPKVDIFGKKEAEVDLEEEEYRQQALARERRRFQDAGRKTPPHLQQKTDRTGRPLSDGRKTPTEASGRQTPTDRLGRTADATGRKTPTDRFGRTTPPGRKTPTSTSGRLTPTGKQTRFDTSTKAEGDRKRQEDSKAKREPGLFDFLGGDADPKESSKSKSRAQTERLHSERSFERGDAGRMKKSVSHDSITEELAAPIDHPSMHQPLPKPRAVLDPDQSSVCEEVEQDPTMKRVREQEREKSAISGKQRSDRLQADNAISLVEDAQYDTEQSKTTKSSRPASSRMRSKSAHQPKPRHSLPGSETSEKSDMMFNSTMSIRQAIYEEWRKEKDKKTKQELLEKRKKENEEKKKKEKEKSDKELEALASYNAWSKQRGETFVKDKIRQKKIEHRKEEDKEREIQEKKKEATINFRMWKEKKDERKDEEHKKKVEEKHRKLQEKKYEKKEKEKQNETAFSGWKKKKDVKLVENIHQKHLTEQRTIQLKKQEERRKEQEALKEYNTWMEKKEKQQRKEEQMKKMKKMRASMGEFDDDYRPAWSPASKVIPYGR